MICLDGSGYSLALLPDAGACFTSLTYKSANILRQTSVEAVRSDPLNSACFPLIPYSNRIFDRSFLHDIRSYNLAPNWSGDRHAIHGEGWKLPWNVLEQSDQSCLLEVKGGVNWPWAYTARMLLQLSAEGLEMTLKIVNDCDDIVPVGLGFHPYFHRSVTTKLFFEAQTERAPIQDDIPPLKHLSSMHDFARPRLVETQSLDHCFGGWSGYAQIVQPDDNMTVTVTANGTKQPWCVVYIPENEDFFCFEPVSHANGALNAACPDDEGVTMLRPGQTVRFSMTISAEVNAAREDVYDAVSKPGASRV